MALWTVIAIVVAAVLLSVLVTFLIVRNSDRKKVAYMLDAFEDGEYNFRFTDTSKFNKTLNRIKWIVEKRRQQNEQESWTKLIRVLTHEIMNTVSPIASLSDALCRHMDDPGHNEDVKSGLQTISSSSKDLIKFVESYRELAGVARPIKKAVMVSDIVYKVLELTSEQCTAYGASCSFTCLSEDALIYADESQISRILINLVKNALQAEARHVTISVKVEIDDVTLITVTNDGLPISRESQEQIFIPFYTTKPDGSGIGLSLSRQIMRAHNGSLELLHSTEKTTAFQLRFS